MSSTPTDTGNSTPAQAYAPPHLRMQEAGQGQTHAQTQLGTAQHWGWKNAQGFSTPPTRVPLSSVQANQAHTFPAPLSAAHQGLKPVAQANASGPGMGRAGDKSHSIAHANPMPALGLASPFTPSDPTSLWGPPGFEPVSALTHGYGYAHDAGLSFGTGGPGMGMPSKIARLEKELAMAHARIRELERENRALRDVEIMRHAQPHLSLGHTLTPSEYDYTSTPLSNASSALYDSSGNLAGYLGGLGLSQMGDEGDDTFSGAAKMAGDSYQPPRGLQIAVLRGVFNYNDMRDNEIRPVVWVIAHAQPGNSLESASLKSAVSNLATRFSHGSAHPSCIILVAAIFEWAKKLCYTSCGNYLCQQLLERGEMADKQKLIDMIKDDIVSIASDKFGTHVLCKAVGMKELEEPIANALLDYGIFDSFKTGARRLWREYLEKCRQSRQLDIFDKINEHMSGRWVELACTNEHGSIACQQIFEVFASPELTQSCFSEILNEIYAVANSQFGHFVVTKLLGYPHLAKATCEAIISAYPPVATTHHGVNFVKIALTELGRPGFAKYIDAICNQDDGKTPGLVAIATASVGKAHLTVFVLNYLNAHEQTRVRNVCKAFSTTLRNSQSGNDLLRSLGLIHAIGSRYRSGSLASG